jgi:hypothetical protein
MTTKFKSRTLINLNFEYESDHRIMYCNQNIHSLKLDIKNVKSKIAKQVLAKELNRWEQKLVNLKNDLEFRKGVNEYFESISN